MIAKSYLDNNKYDDFAYGFTLNIRSWEIIFGNLIHKNKNIGSPSSIEIRKFF